MIAVLEEREEAAIKADAPYLSYSRVNRYLTCPESYRLYYIENLRLRKPSANLVFGQVIHQALAALFKAGRDPAQVFVKDWTEAAKVDLTYGARDNWDKLFRSGQALLRTFVQEEAGKLAKVHGVEKVFQVRVTSLDLPFVGVVDLVADVEGKRTVVDWKTSGSEYQGHEVEMSDQLTAYQLAEPEALQVALCVLVKGREPKVEWHLSTRTGDQLEEYLGKVAHVGAEIASGCYYKRPGIWCSWCDFLPCCLGDRKRVEDTLVQSGLSKERKR